MKGVDPLRYDETRRRIAAVIAYIAIDRPDDRERRLAAKGVGLSVNQFLALVRAWREHESAAAIACSGAGRGAARPDSRRNLPAESKDVVRATLASLGAGASPAEVTRNVNARCAELGFAPPSRSTIWNMMMAARREGGAPSGAGRDLVVSRLHARLPIAIDGVVAYPELVVALDPTDGVVLAVALSGDDSAARTLADGIGRRADRTSIVADATLADTIGEMPGRTIERVNPAVARRAAAKAIGRGMAKLDVIYQRGRAIAPTQALRSTRDAPVTLADARRAIEEQAAAHNAARHAPPPRLSWVA